MKGFRKNWRTKREMKRKVINLNSKIRWIDGKSLPSEELKKIAQIDNNIPKEFDPHWKPNKDKNDRRIKYYKKLTDKDFFQVLYCESEICGFHIIRDTGNSIAYISTLWVDPRFRNLGLGKKLKEKGLNWAKDSGFKFLHTSVQSKNVRMNEINQKNGFEIFSSTYRLTL